MHPSYCFAIDVTHTAVQSGLLAASVAAILSALDGLAEAEARGGAKNIHVGLCAFDAHLHFFDLTRETDDHDFPPVFVVCVFFF